mgnify:CR=1 FL=1
MLEYVLLVGDVTGPLSIPTHFVQSINEPEQDVTDYPYSFFVDDPQSEDYDVMEPRFILGRFSVRSPGDLMLLKSRTIQYTRMENLSDDEMDYLNNGLLVAGNYSEEDGEEIPPSQWPVTPVWTSQWIYDEWVDFGYTEIDTAYFHASNQFDDNPLIGSSWTDGVGVINYLGWGNSQGWHYPTFVIDQIEPELNNGWKLPIVASFVSNTGDFGADLINGPVKCFAEELTTRGTLGAPKGGVAVIGPSDLYADTRYSNVISGMYWQALLEEETAEIGVALHIGKQSLITEFPQLAGHGDVVEFYHHVYMVIGDPSIPAWLLRPTNLSADIELDTDLHQSFISTIVTNEDGEPVEDVVGALLLDGELIGKGLSLSDGTLQVDFSGISDGSTLSLYLNKAQFLQKNITINYIDDDGSQMDSNVWAYFDLQPILSNGNNYVEAGEYIDLFLDIMNPSSNTFNDVTVSISEITNGIFSGSFDTDQITINEFSSITTNSIASGMIEYYEIGSNVIFQINFNYGGELIAQNTISLTLGPIDDTDPIPPDSYGYWAYDNFDLEYPEAPIYNWIELNPNNGGSGDLIPLDDNSHYQMVLPFEFQYYGESFNNVTIGSNGWLSLIPCNIDYFWNYSIPMNMGPSAMIAPFMDDLGDNDGQELFEVYAWSDLSEGRFIVQWDNVSNSADDEYCQTLGCVKETFQVILYNPEMYPTQTGDGEILFQYQEINDIDVNGNYSTIGIESPDQTIGVQYLFNNITAAGSFWPVEVISNDNYSYYHLNQELAIKFTTNNTANDSIELLGCTDPEAINHCGECTEDDGSCYYISDLIIHFDSDAPDFPISPMGVYIYSATMDMIELKIGDEIGIFEGDACIGSIQLQAEIDNPVQLFLSLDNPNTPEIDGYISGNPLQFRYWDESEGNEIINIENYLIDGSGFYAPMGSASVDLFVESFFGCTDNDALNYDANANVDDGSCIFPVFGCMLEEACNFNPEANVDDESCIYNDCMEVCGGEAFFDDCDECSGGTSSHNENSDKDCNNECFGTAYLNECEYCVEGNTELSEGFGFDCDGVCDGEAIIDECGCVGGTTGNEPQFCFGCTDQFAINYDESSWVNDGSCLYPGIGDFTMDGVINVIDLVQLVEVVLDGEEYIEYMDINQDGFLNIIDIVALVDIILNPEYLGCTDPLAPNYNPIAIYENGECEFYNTVIDVNGNLYPTIEIGTQEWIAENLKVTHYRNGDEIPTGFSNAKWVILSDNETGAYAIYDNDPINSETYGNLYNWYAVGDDRGICPEGWHVPSDDEWMTLEMQLGMRDSSAYSVGWRGTDEGSQLAGHADLWFDGGLENNSEFGISGFFAHPGGSRSGGGAYLHVAYRGSFWTSTGMPGSFAWARGLNYDNSGVDRGISDKLSGKTVRCIRD